MSVAGDFAGLTPTYSISLTSPTTFTAPLGVYADFVTWSDGFNATRFHFSSATSSFSSSGPDDLTIYATGAQSVPEPTTILMLGSALAGIGLIGRKTVGPMRVFRMNARGSGRDYCLVKLSSERDGNSTCTDPPAARTAAFF